MNKPTWDSTRALVYGIFDGTDKGGIPYWLHCLDVEERLDSLTEDERFAALLHDVVEDSPLTLDDLRSFGYSERTLYLVDKLTRRKENGTYRQYIEGIAATKDAGLIRIKLADNAANSDPVRLAQLPEHERSIERRYKMARTILEAALAAT